MCRESDATTAPSRTMPEDVLSNCRGLTSGLAQSPLVALVQLHLLLVVKKFLRYTVEFLCLRAMIDNIVSISYTTHH